MFSILIKREVVQFTMVVNMVKTIHQFVGNKAKGSISKRALQENKARQIFRKRNITHTTFLTTTFRMCACQRVRNVRFSENLVCFVFL